MIDDIIDLESALLALPPEDIEIMRLWMKGYTVRETGRMMAIPKSTVHYRLKRAKQFLRSQLDGYTKPES